MPTDSLLRHQSLPPPRLSRELREGRSDDLRRRRIGIGLSFAGATIGGVVGAYQTGLIGRLPDVLPGKVFDAERVDASDYAYQRMQTPDGILMMITYSTTAALFAAGGKDRGRDNRALCSWCQLATVASALSLMVALPEAIRAKSRSADHSSATPCARQIAAMRASWTAPPWTLAPSASGPRCCRCAHGQGTAHARVPLANESSADRARS